MGGNAEQIDYWNGSAGETWVRAQARLDAMLAPISEIVIARAAVRAGERVLDVGCGCGDSSLRLADLGAQVHGVDVSEPMLALARRRSADRSDVRFTHADAGAHSFAPEHDVLFSRFGVMFFDDPTAAFANLRRGLVPGGRLCFVCWQAPRSNPWMAVAGAAIQPFLAPPASPPDPRAPGPFAFADSAYLQGLLGAAGFEAIACEDLRVDLHLADDLDAALEFQGEVGPLARALAELEGSARTQAVAAAREALAAHLTEDGLDLGAACWIVTARA